MRILYKNLKICFTNIFIKLYNPIEKLKEFFKNEI